MTTRTLNPMPPSTAGAEHPDASVLDELLTAIQLAEILQMRVSTIEDYARRGILPSIKLGRHRRFIRSNVEQAIGDLIRPATGWPRLMR